MSASIRPVTMADREQWELLWQGYQAFYKVQVPKETTDLTWNRFFDPTEPVYAVAAEEDGVLIGLVHFIFHRNTWMAGPVCYLQDLFTTETARGKGVGRALIETVYDRAREAGSPRVYWLTHETNAAAMMLYDKVAERSGFVQYRMTL
jgi:GNAT superfamily N-acetyltransferase